MASTDLHLEDPGSIAKPGPIGRIVRLAFGVSCGWYVLGLIEASSNLYSSDGHIRPLIWNGIVVGLFLVSYIINIGFSRAWKKWPAIVSAGAFLALAGIGQLMDENFESPILARSVWVWELYLSTHLGLAFMISGLIGTPGCEMRSFHDLFSRFTGVAAREHDCPVGPISPIDKWEFNRSWMGH